MRRILPETQLEMKMLCFGAIFIEENFVLDSLYETILTDISEDMDIMADESRLVLNEMSEAFFRLDMNYGAEVKGDCIGILEEFWDVRDKASAEKNIENILLQGHRVKFNVLATSLSENGSLDKPSLQRFKQIFSFDFSEDAPPQMTEEDYQKLASWLVRSKTYIKDVGILGWDAARYVHLTRLCYIAGYIESDQVWSYILKLAPVVEGKFSSWMEFAQSFLIGRTFLVWN